MQEKRKKFWIIFSISIFSLISIMFLFGMATRLTNVNVEFRQRLSQNKTRLEESILDKIKEDAQFDYGTGMLFIDFQKNIDLIEKNNPFVEVHQVVTEFPNTVNIYIIEREACCYARFNNYYLVLDKSFKVLDKIEATSQGYDYLKEEYLDTIYEIDYEFVEDNLSAGDFVKDNGKMIQYKQIYLGIMGALESVSAVKRVEFNTDKICIIMKKDSSNFDDGTIIELDGFDDIKMKTYVAIEYFEVRSKTTSLNKIKVKKDDANQNQYIAYEA